TQQGMVGDSTLFDRVWLSSPLLRPRHGQHWLKIAGARLVARWFPEAILDTGVRPAKCRHVDAAKAKAAGDYDLCHHFISVSMGAELLAAGDRLADAAPPLGDPVRVLITQGLEDGICPPAFSHAFFEKIPARDKLYVPLPGLRHETLREPGNELLIEAVEAWLGA
ncbi:MAG: alpha/beta hydrolase, partial [Verrucomicrobiae bacterium]|nr:alpha/beta hydrolase [Verrucomicrobiae bacterium]